MRSDIIDEILSVEDHADRIVKDAESQSRETIINAQAKANDLIHQAVAEEREKNRVELDKAEQASAKELDDYSVSLEGKNELPSSAIDNVAQKIVMLVSNTTLFGAS